MKRDRKRRRLQTDGANSRPGWWRPLLLVFAAAAVYWSGLSAPFIFDDRAAIEENVELRQWPDIARVLKSAPPETPLSGRPVASLTFALNYAVGGSDVRGYRLVNIAIHAACALLLFALVRRTVSTLPFGRQGSPSPENLAFAAALLWVVHPLNSEVVCYLSQRTDSLMGFFALLTLLASVRARESTHQDLWQAAALTSASLGMACKETMVVVPVLVVLYDRIFVFGSLREAFAARGRFYGTVAASWIVLAFVVFSTPRTFAAGFSSTDPSVWNYLLHQTVVITKYLTLSVWPRGLVLFYGWAMPTSLAAVWPYAILVSALAALAVVALWRRPALGFLGAWFFITLAPTSSLAPVAGEVGAERRMYLSLMAVVVLGVVGAVWVWRRLAAGWPPGVALARGRLAGPAACGIVVALLGAGSVVRTWDYASALAMARTVYAHWPSGAASHMLGTELMSAGQRDEGLRYLREGASTYPPSRFALGALLFEMGSYEAAVGELRAFIRVEPNLDTSRRAELLIPEALGRQGQWSEAIRWLKEIVAKSPHRPDAIGALADAYFTMREFPGAIATYETFLTLQPGQPQALANLAIAYAATGRLDGAINAFRQVAQTQPGGRTGEPESGARAPRPGGSRRCRGGASYGNHWGGRDASERWRARTRRARARTSGRPRRCTGGVRARPGDRRRVCPRARGPVQSQRGMTSAPPASIHALEEM